MKITESNRPSLLNGIAIEDIPLGTVFKYGDHGYGPYLRVDVGFVSIMTNIVLTRPDGSFDNYLAFPNARIVLD